MGSTTPVSEQIVGLNYFQSFNDSPILDLRSAEAFKSGHLVGASHFEPRKLGDRMHELPKREQSLRLLGEKNALQIAKVFLVSKGYHISACLEWNVSVNDYLLQSGQLITGDRSTRLWSPAPVVEWFHEKKLAGDLMKKRALDIACGSGRDAVYLASHGWNMSVIDYSASALDKVKVLAGRHHVTVKCHQIDLEKQLDSFEAMPEEYDLISVSRYLNRPLLPIIKQKIAAKGFLVYQTFLVGCERFSGPKKSKFLLKPGELLDFFSGFDVILDEVVFLPDGRPTNVFVAQNQ